MGGRISQKGKDNKVIRSDASAFMPKNKNIINTDRRNRRSTGWENQIVGIAEDGYRAGTEHIQANTRSIQDASFTTDNINRVEDYLRTNFPNPDGSICENNEVMIDRARAIERGELEATDTDKAFLTHELRERELRETGMEYNEAHAQTCKEYGFDANAENTEPHPFYTKEAQDAFDKAELERAIR